MPQLVRAVGAPREPCQSSVLAEEVRDHATSGPRSQVGDLVARELDDDELVRSASSRSSAGRADVARQLDGHARPLGRGGGERRGRALALRAGDADHAPARALGEPERRSRVVTGSPAARSAVQLGAVDRDAGRAHDDVAAGQRGDRAGGRRRRVASARRAPRDIRSRSLESNATTAIRAAGRPPASCARERARSRGRRPTRRSRAPSSSEKRTDVVHQLRSARRARRSARAPRPGSPSCRRWLRQHLGGEPPHDGWSRQRGSAASRRIAARLSCSSPTHSNGLCPPVAVSSANPSNWRLVVEQVAAEDLARGASGSLNGASTRKTKRHFGQSPHHDARAQRGIEAEDRVAARERAVVALQPRERARDRQLGGGTQHREDARQRAPASATAAAQQPLGASALAELVVDLDAVPATLPARGRALVRHRDRVEAVQRGGQQRDARDDRRDRDVAVQRAGSVELVTRAGRSRRVATRRGSPAAAAVRCDRRRVAEQRTGRARALRAARSPARRSSPCRRRSAQATRRGGRRRRACRRGTGLCAEALDAAGAAGGCARRTRPAPPSRAPRAARPPPAAARPVSQRDRPAAAPS